MVQPDWNTATMAELYVTQGHLNEALHIYEQLHANNPDDTQTEARCNQLRIQLGLEVIPSATIPVTIPILNTTNNTIKTQQQAGVNMSFGEHVRRVQSDVPGALYCGVMALDGIAIDSVTAENSDLGDIDIQSMVTLFNLSASRMMELEPEAGRCDELLIASEKAIFLLKMINHEYFFATLLTPQGWVGKARYMMRAAVPSLAAELL